MKSTATARWEGTAGKITAGTGLFRDAPYNAKGRFEGGFLARPDVQRGNFEDHAYLLCRNGLSRVGG